MRRNEGRGEMDGGDNNEGGMAVFSMDVAFFVMDKIWRK